MMQPPPDEGVTFTQPSQWVWQVSVDGTRVGTVNGHDSCGFTASDMDNHPIGHGYISAKAAIHACVHDRQPVLTQLT
jgi:hypothetical protein